MKYITDTTVKDINILTYIINVYDADLDENSEFKFVFTSTKTNYIIKEYVNNYLQRVQSYTVEEFNKNYTLRSYMLSVLSIENIVNTEDYEL